MKRLIISSAVVVIMTGCSTVGTKAQTQTQAPLPSPTPAVVKDQTMPAQGKVENSATIDIPAWYIKAPASTEDYVYLTGTGISSDLSMSRSKALLDAQVQLADKINGMINALIKQNKRDDAGNVNTDRTTQTVKKVIIDTAITGYHLEDSKVMSENRGYRTFVLVRYPIGDANRMLKDKLQRERTDIETDSAADRELEQEMDQRRVKKPVPAPVPEKQSAVPVIDIRPVASGPVDLQGQPVAKLMDISDPKIRAIRDTAAAKPGAIVEHTTVQ
jgi:uncharacterized protein YceK